MSAPALVTFGETMALLTNPEVGPLRHATSLAVSAAGTESNVAIGVRRLGLPAAWMGRVGDDEFGRLVLHQLRGEDVDVSAATIDPAGPTGLMVKSTRAAGVTQVTYYRRGSAASHMTADDLDVAAIGTAGVLHVTGITTALSTTARDAVWSAIEAAREAGVTVCVDPNYRSALWPADEAARCFHELVARADVVLAGEDEAALMYGSQPPDRLARALAGAGPAQAVVKRGPRGALAVIDGTIHEAEGLPVQVVDPVGAGDAFAAGYLAGLLDGAAAAERLALATRVGAFAVTVSGDWEGLPSRDELALLDASDGPGVYR